MLTRQVWLANWMESDWHMAHSKHDMLMMMSTIVWLWVVGTESHGEVVWNFLHKARMSTRDLNSCRPRYSGAPTQTHIWVCAHLVRLMCVIIHLYIIQLKLHEGVYNYGFGHVFFMPLECSKAIVI